MKTDAVTPQALRRSVISVPPLARNADLTFNESQNAALLTYMRGGGVTTYMYGGNANLYHMGISEFGPFLDMLARLAQEGDWMIPSIGGDFGKAMDQAAIAREHAFPTVMVLPQRFPVAPSGVATGLRRIAERYGKPIIAYVKDEGYVEPEDLGKLVADGLVCAIKYAIVRENPAQDAYLSQLLDHVDRDLVISGIGERPVVDHFREFGLRAFTSGSVCVAPRLSNAIRVALQNGDYDSASMVRELFIPLEDARDGHSPMRVLHDAVGFAGIADMGPMLPMQANLTDERAIAETRAAAAALRKLNDEAA
ncbi:MAG: dihydrodipicolinate synthase family protein [Salinarimonas sp.]